MADSTSDKQKPRQKHNCPVCQSSVIHLPRHLRDVHKWTMEKSITALTSFDLRAKRTRKETAHESKSTPRQHKRRVCPFPGCSAVVRRLHNHLTGKHKLNRHKEQYKRLLKTATFAELPEDDDLDEVISLSSSAVSEGQDGQGEESTLNVEDIPDDCNSSNDIIPPTPRKEKLFISPKLFCQLKSKTTKKDDNQDYQQPSGDESSIDSDEDPEWTATKSYESDDSDEVEETKQQSHPQSLASHQTSHSPDDNNTDSYYEEDDNEDNDMEGIEVESPEHEVGGSSNSLTMETLKQFQEWLKGIDGGRREEKTARQYVSQISSIIQTVDPKGFSVTSILDVKELRDKWLVPLENCRRPGTCKAYLGSLSKFLRFLMVENPENIPTSQEPIRKAKEQVMEWMSSYNAPIAERRWEKQLEDLEKLVTPKDIKEFDTSDLARSAVSTLGVCMDKSARGTLPPTQAEYCLVRDYLLTSICINNACRAGPLSSMTLAELEKAEKQDNQIVVNVLKHKTMRYHGPATVVLSATIYKWVLAFVSHMRGRLASVCFQTENRIFLSWTGKEMGSSMISGQINSFWQRATGSNERVSATAFRKAAVSAVHSDHTHLKKDLADLMSHNPKTAEKFYLIREKRKNAAKTAQSLQNILRGSSSCDIQDANEVEEHTEETMSPTEGHSARHKWSKEEEEAIRKCFLRNIQRKVITLEETRQKLKDHPILGNFEATKVRDKVRSLFGDEADEPTPSLPTAEESAEDRVQRLMQSEEVQSSVSLFTRTSRKGGAFSDEQTETVVKLFEDLVTTTASINRSSVMERIKQDSAAKALLEGFKPQQICDKIRAERKRYRNSNK